jgi:hypothetical protein
MKGGLPGENLGSLRNHTEGGPDTLLHAGLDLSRRRLDVHLMDDAGVSLLVDAFPPDSDGLAHLARELSRFDGERVHAVIESMNGARFVHDTLELAGWDVEIADAQRVKGLAPLACKTDKIDAKVLGRCWIKASPATQDRRSVALGSSGVSPHRRAGVEGVNRPRWQVF